MMKNNKTPFKGQKYFRFNKKTKELEDLEIVDIQYVFNRRIGSRSNFTQEEIENFIADGTITDEVDALKEKAIAQLEEQFGIKLKEV